MDHQAITLRGKVFGPSGDPVANAKLYVAGDGTSDQPIAQPNFLGVCDTDGSYWFDVPRKYLSRQQKRSSRDCDVALIATLNDLGVGWVTLPSAKADSLSDLPEIINNNIRLVADSTINGQIVDSDGQGIPNAQILVKRIIRKDETDWARFGDAIDNRDYSIFDSPIANTSPYYWGHVMKQRWLLFPDAWSIIPATVSDDAGRFCLRQIGAERTVIVEIVANGVKEKCAILNRDNCDALAEHLRRKMDLKRGNVYGRSNTLKIEVDQRPTISGVVRDRETGKPLSGISIGVSPRIGKREGITDARGRYHVRCSSRDPILVRPNVIYSKLPYLQPEAKQIPLAETDVDVDFELVRGVEVTGRIMDETTGEPPISQTPGPCASPICGTVQYVTLQPGQQNEADLSLLEGISFEDCGAQRPYISPDGTFRFVAMPIPAVLLVRLATAWAYMPFVFDESNQMERHDTYLPIKHRTPDDGASADTGEAFATQSGHIKLTDSDEWSTNGVQAYRVIRPGADARSLHYEFRVRPGQNRKIRFVTTDGGPVDGVVVQGLARMKVWSGDVRSPIVIRIERNEAEIIAMDPDNTRPIVAISRDGQSCFHGAVSADDFAPLNATMVPVGKVNGKLLDDHGEPLVGYTPWPNYPDHPEWLVSEVIDTATPTNEEGYFELPTIIPNVRFGIRFNHPSDRSQEKQIKWVAKQALAPGQTLALGNIRNGSSE